MAPQPERRPIAALEQDARARVDRWLAEARRVLDLTPRRLPAPEVAFDLTGRAAGQAVLARRGAQPDRIRINAGLLASHTEAMLAETIPHEVAHVAVHRANADRVKPHGSEWRALMAAFGVPARACHNLPSQPARWLRCYAYRCGCAEPAWLSAIRHNRVLRGARYRCRRCGEALVRSS